VKKRIPYFLLAVLLLPCWGIALKPGGDLGVYYQASTWLQKGWVARLYSDNAEIGNFFYGPFGLAILKPLAFLTLPQANVLWLGLQTLSYVVFWTLLVKVFPELIEAQHIWLFILIWIASVKPIHASFQSHNVQLMFAAILIAAELGSHSRQKWLQWASGAAVTLVASIKIYPAFIAISYLLTKPIDVKKGLFLGGIISLVTPLAVFGPSVGAVLPQQFITNALHYHRVYDLAKDTVSLSLPSLLTTWFPSVWITHGGVGLIVGVCALAVFTFNFSHRKKLTYPQERYFWSFLWAMMALLNSTTRPDYFIYFVPAFGSIVLLSQTSPHRKQYQWGLAASLVLIAFITEWTLGSRELTHYLESLRIPVLGILLLCFMHFSSLRNMLKT
jgi:Glycosyltransferase family 87